MAVELTCRVTKRLDSGFQIDAELTIPLDPAHVTVLFGPSGSGKTTLLRLLAGLDRPDAGEIRHGGAVWFSSSVDLKPQNRRAGFLFQDYALFPHLTVAENVGYAASAGKAAEMLKSLGIPELAARKPRELSGGQQQRVALARALAAEPALLLLDEPLSALDAATRLRTRQELRRVLVAGAAPAVIVTHDRAEAIALGDYMAVMIGGRIRQFAPVGEVFRHPVDAEVAESVGVENVLPAIIDHAGSGLLSLRIAHSTLECVESPGVSSRNVWACIRAEDIVLSPGAPQATSARNRIPGRVASVTPEGALARVELDCGFPLVSAITAQSAQEMGLRPGQEICAVIKATAIHLISAASGMPPSQ